MHFHFGIAENKNGTGVFEFDDADKGTVLVQAGDEIVEVVGLGDMDVVAAEGEVFRLAHELLGSLHDLCRKGGGKHAGVDAAGGQVAFDLKHVREKTHGQHPVGFVEDEHFEGIQREGAPEQVIEDPAGCADDDVRAALERVHLRAVAHPAIDRDRAEARTGEERFSGLGDLFGKFTGGDQDEGLAHLPAGVEQFQQGEDERARFAAPRAGLDHHVFFCKEIGDGFGLDGGEDGPVSVFCRGLEAFGELFEGDFREGVLRCFGGSIQKVLF